MEVANINNKGSTLLVLILLIVIGCVVFSVVWTLSWNASRTTKIVTIDDKWVKYHNNNAKYLFSDKDGNVYCICDDWLIWLFNASDRYAEIKVNQTYEITFIGWRIHFISWYPNAIDITTIE